MPNTTSQLERLIRNGSEGQVERQVQEAVIRLNEKVAILNRQVEMAKLNKQAAIEAATTEAQLAKNSADNLVFASGASGADIVEQILNSMDYRDSKEAYVTEVTQKWDAEVAKLQARAAAFAAKVQNLLA